jgi:hypothetical protein
VRAAVRAGDWRQISAFPNVNGWSLNFRDDAGYVHFLPMFRTRVPGGYVIGLDLESRFGTALASRILEAHRAEFNRMGIAVIGTRQDGTRGVLPGQGLMANVNGRGEMTPGFIIQVTDALSVTSRYGNDFRIWDDSTRLATGDLTELEDRHITAQARVMLKGVRVRWDRDGTGTTRANEATKTAVIQAMEDMGLAMGVTRFAAFRGSEEVGFGARNGTWLAIAIRSADRTAQWTVTLFNLVNSQFQEVQVLPQ